MTAPIDPIATCSMCRPGNLLFSSAIRSSRSMPPGAQGFLAPNLGQGKSAEPEDIADLFDQALRDAAGDQDLG